MPYGKTKLSQKDMAEIRKQSQKQRKYSLKLKKIDILKKRKRKPIKEPKRFRYNTSGDLIGGEFFFG